MKVPFVDLSRAHSQIMPEIEAAIKIVIKEDAYILGRHVDEFERNFAEYCQAEYAAGVSTGLDALELILRAWGVKEGDEVITAPNSFIASASAIQFTGANPVFVDCGGDYLIDVNKIEAAITPRTRAIMPVHLYGQPADMDEVMEIAGKYNLKVVEDACESHGAEYKSRKVGSIGDAAAFSFFPSKNLGALGDAGIVVSNDRELVEEIKIFRHYGQSEKYHHDRLGFNKRMDGLQAAVLNVKLKHLDQWNLQRQEAAEFYDKSLKGVVETPLKHVDRSHVYHLYVIRTGEREGLQRKLIDDGIGNGMHFPIPIHHQATFADYKAERHTNTEKYAGEILSLPMFPGITREEQVKVVDSIKDFYN
ncbi:MAG: DegT/DnrJ/EryC1/StrS family aminotransferase [archaeon]